MLLHTRTSPVALHFGALETRLLQLDGGPGGWTLREAHSVSAAGEKRHLGAATALLDGFDFQLLRGKDVCLGTGGNSVSLSVVPVDPERRGRLQQTLRDTAARAVDDPEGAIYRYLPLASASNLGDTPGREEFLLLTAGAGEIRRCQVAAESMGLQPVGLEMDAFAIARGLAASCAGSRPWGFLHMGWEHAMFGVVHQGEIRFLKPIQLDGKKLVEVLENTLADGEPAWTPDSSTAVLDNRAVGHAVEILHALRRKADALAQEVRACLRHFATRNGGAKLGEIFLTGLGAGLPEVEGALGSALGIPTSVANPFQRMGISLPDGLHQEEHLWCAALGLAIRGYEE